MHTVTDRRTKKSLTEGFILTGRWLRLTHLLGHLLHDVTGDVSDRCVAQAFDRYIVFVTLQLSCVDVSVINVGIQGADEY